MGQSTPADSLIVSGPRSELFTISTPIDGRTGDVAPYNREVGILTSIDGRRGHFPVSSDISFTYEYFQKLARI
jgi:hypothetical protein